MKRLSILILVALMSLSASAIVVAQTGIQTTKHNFMGEGWNTSNQVCLPCHAPHGHYGATVRLWNHAPTTASFSTKYDEMAKTYTTGTVAEKSKRCLSCHDGTVALDAFSGNGGTPANTMGAFHPKSNLTNDLSNDHPISVEYKPANTDPAKPYTGTSLKATSGTGMVGGVLRLSKQADGFAYNVECSTCHAPHGKTETVNGIVQNTPNLLNLNNTGSALCLTCHNK